MKKFIKRLKVAEKQMKLIRDSGFEITPLAFQLNITDQRDIDEIERRKKKKTVHPLKNELYSVNPNFDGNYSDPENR